NITTVISILAGVIFLKEPFTLRQAIASLIILIGVYGVNRCVAAQQERDAQESEAVAVEK
ncbi:MAG: EamA family transporter, partial [Firmicutes bacterium]|nr:EamA family transporter [Bacillota bacterium]